MRRFPLSFISKGERYVNVLEIAQVLPSMKRGKIGVNKGLEVFDQLFCSKILLT